MCELDGDTGRLDTASELVNKPATIRIIDGVAFIENVHGKRKKGAVEWN